ncbi:hypothetical protein CPB84DRAFT_1782204 [Gymnopilus junonius]|uniref:Uncharacterized protein n=1 Tax=Gymnopilus junonius TaxID=109634 RepID=A0A9P5NLC7_GYMJU|nr:hypothetical protein CPB84DRAFT_1782204 [Gymnopilus junonius]
MGLTFNLAVAIGLIAGFVFGGLLAVAWYLFKRRSRQVPSEDNLTAMKSQFPRKRRRLRFTDEVDSPKTQRQRQTLVSHSYATPPRNQLLMQQNRGQSFRSIDTVSIYSTDSAPLDLHDEHLQTGSGSEERPAPETYHKTKRKQWHGYPTLDPFYSDKIPRTLVSPRRHKQTGSLLPLYNDPTSGNSPTVKHVVPLLYGRGFSCRNTRATPS